MMSMQSAGRLFLITGNPVLTFYVLDTISQNKVMDIAQTLIQFYPKLRSLKDWYINFDQEYLNVNQYQLFDDLKLNYIPNNQQFIDFFKTNKYYLGKNEIYGTKVVQLFVPLEEYPRHLQKIKQFVNKLKRKK